MTGKPKHVTGNNLILHKALMTMEPTRPTEYLYLRQMMAFAILQILTHGGTFNSAPVLFNQLYVIRCPLGPSAVSCVYAFLSNKLQSTYEELLTSVLDRCIVLGLQPDPTTVITDYELAAINVVHASLGSQVTTTVSIT